MNKRRPLSIKRLYMLLAKYGYQLPIEGNGKKYLLKIKDIELFLRFVLEHKNDEL